MNTSPPPASPPRVALFITCLVDLFRPNVGAAAIKLLQQAGCKVVVPQAQTCCGQPAYNSGDKRQSREIAKRTITAFEPYETVVAPSGSCAGMIKKHYPDLFTGDDPEDAKWYKKATALGEKTSELLTFLSDRNTAIDAEYSGTVCYHDSCAGLRELNIKDQPRALLKQVKDLKSTPLKNSDVCCGFGGMFCVKYADVSNKMVSDKLQHIQESGADTVLAGDLGCLLNIAGKLSRENSPVRVWHTAEVLAGLTRGSAIAEPEHSNLTDKRKKS